MEWISVEDRLPITAKDVVIWLGDDGWSTGWYTRPDQRWINHRDNRTCYPIFWAEVITPQVVMGSNLVMATDTASEQPLQKWQQYNKVIQASICIQNEVRALIIDLAELGEGSQTFGDAIAALKHLEVVTEHLTTASEDLKPEPSLNEVLANINKRVGVSVKNSNS